jgi:hypothetical protein
MVKLKSNKMSKSRKPTHGGGGGTNTTPQVTGLTAALTIDKHVQLNWNTVPNATSYWVRRSDQSQPIAVMTTNSYLDSYPVAGTSSYKVAAVVGGVLGADSAPASVTV